MLDLNNKVALITGVNNPQGIGASTANSLAKAGAKVVCVYKKLKFHFNENETRENGFNKYHKALSCDAAEVEEQIKQFTNNYLIIERDSVEKDNITDIFNIIEQRFGNVEIFVNNAAMCSENDTIFYPLMTRR
ncbi:MAG: hypothetical protein LBD57_02205 [Endomicrobium sp.]|jgi:3-oxoacyl-[acyl-carrier protein] reductase|uniref:hypothetical protein n=1 Tax=Candidatus Endomicrobiellum cubanum TaxID=3242325 RepID=UPI0028186082|nr:hypothetical protein [Endomicrobium sp.]